jgi:hypothetical protein
MEYKDLMKDCQQNIAKSELKPLFANEVFVATPIKTKKDKKGKLHREGYVELIFIDVVTRKPVSRVVLLPALAKDFVNTLASKMKEYDKMIKSTKVDKKKAKEVAPVNYIG